MCCWENQRRDDHRLEELVCAGHPFKKDGAVQLREPRSVN
jgi:hypothetical protein